MRRFAGVAGFSRRCFADSLVVAVHRVLIRIMSVRRMPLVGGRTLVMASGHADAGCKCGHALERDD